MPLFIVRHQHSPETCPARDPAMGAMLLNHLSRPSAARHGVVIQGEAVVRGAHSLFFIAEAADEIGLQAFLTPFRQVGEVEVMAASTCAGVVASGGCDARPPHVSAVSLDPADACQDAIEAGLLVHRAYPLNGETSVPDLAGGAVMPNGRFYLRDHFDIPKLDGESYRLSVGGLVQRSLSLSMRDLRNLRAESLVVTLECAGNGRSLFDPAVPGEAWGLGAVSTAEWTGVPLIDREGGPATRRDGTHVPRRRRRAYRGSRSADPFRARPQLHQIREAGALLAYEMNGEPLSSPHGYPLRLIVPGWYAVASRFVGAAG